jgi:hypothetical protein
MVADHLHDVGPDGGRRANLTRVYKDSTFAEWREGPAVYSASHKPQTFYRFPKTRSPSGESPKVGCNVFEIATRRVVNGAWQSMGGCSEDTVLAPTGHQ